MRLPNVFSHGILAVTVVLAVLAGGCDGESDPRYELKGQVLSLSADRMEASIKHEEIPNFMGAMTMQYRVRDPNGYEGLAPGDLITATLVVESNGAYLTDVKRVGNAPLEQAPEAAPQASSGFELLKPGETVPMTAFVDQDGKPRTFESFKGSTVVLTFIYTTCPMPTFCPLMDRHFVAIQETLKADPALKNVHLVTVSFDPITDTPAALKKHAETLGADLARWTFLTGDRDNVDQFAMRFGVSIERGLTNPIDITHNLRTAIVDGSGRVLKTYTGNSWTPAEILADLRKGAGAN